MQLWACNVLNTYKMMLSSEQQNRLHVMWPVLKIRNKWTKQQGVDGCIQRPHLQQWQLSSSWDCSKEIPQTDLWDGVIAVYAVKRPSFFPNPHGDHFKPWSMKCDYPCPVFELGDCEERLSDLTCVREGTTGTKPGSCFCMSLWSRGEVALSLMSWNFSMMK